MTIKQTASKLTDLIWPITRVKLHRLLHIGGVLAAVALAVVVALQSQVSIEGRIGADLVILTTLLTKWQALFKQLDAAVNTLPIPVDDEITKPETPTAKGGK